MKVNMFEPSKAMIYLISLSSMHLILVLGDRPQGKMLSSNLKFNNKLYVILMNRAGTMS